MQKKKHILVVSQYFYPEQFRINDICQEWVKRGYQVTVVTGIPNYPEGKFYPGYGFFKRRTEKWNGVRIIRIPLIARGKTPIGMVANYLSFVISSFLWVRFTKVKADYVFTFEVSPMTQALLGVWYSKKHKIPNYLYVQDLWPENVEIVTGIHSPFILKPIGKMVDYIYRNCDQIFATSPSFVEEICKRGVEEVKVHYWPQYAEEFYKPLKRKPTVEIPDEECFKIIFTGNIGYAQGLEILPRTAEMLKHDNEKVKFYIVGDGRYKPELLKEIKQRKVDDMFKMIDRQPAERIPDLLAACDAAFISFKDEPLFYKTIPAKLQSYMACGMPIIASASGETERIIKESKCGVCSPIGNYSNLSDEIKKMAKKDIKKSSTVRKNSEEYYEKNFNKKLLMDKIESYFGE
ncbi:glycosyltransferase WbuB [Drancourtella sp. An57]|uniref:glycosyltransferase family 4 protein n=1 Tax=Drancourtella sp. An57 TaxID=1965647 RepID=UPI000B39D337|nr:glycosyltransferase family 4 protein [Drancourtella sp. An57]OUN70155.1 glycosyltransferase WbuB [Drancourtella sp. An57]